MGTITQIPASTGNTELTADVAQAASVIATVGGPAGKVVGSAIAALDSIVKVFFKGANPNQVPSAQDEQVYEAAADNVAALVKAGYLDQTTGIGIINSLISQGTVTMQNLQAKIGNLGGLQNMLNTLQAEIVYVQGMPVMPLITFTSGDAEVLYIQPNASGWYATSISQATTLTDQLVTQYISLNPNGQFQETSGAQQTINSATAAVQNLSSAVSTAITTGNTTAVTNIVAQYPLTTIAIVIFIVFLLTRKL